MIVVIDNYDSFTYNLVQRLGEIDASAEIRVVRNDRVSVEELAQLGMERLIISPGPCTPNEAGVSVDAVRRFAGVVPILGVCLGHQSIGQAFGATIVRAPQLMHGKTDQIQHDDQQLFCGIDQPFTATRYHSLVIDPDSMPQCLAVSAWTDTGGTRQIMAVRHRTAPIIGWQFHPESFLSEVGVELLRRFLNWNPVPQNQAVSA